MSAAQPDPTNSSSSAGNQRCATSRPAAGLEASSAMVIVTAILSEEQGSATGGRARGRSARRAARAPPLDGPARCGSPSTWQSTGPVPLTCASATACVVTPGCASIRPEKNAGTPRRMPHVERDVTTTTCSSPSSMRGVRRDDGAVAVLAPVGERHDQGPHVVAAAVHLDRQVVGLEHRHLAKRRPRRSPPCPAGRGRSPRTAAPRAHPGPRRPR